MPDTAPTTNNARLAEVRKQAKRRRESSAGWVKAIVDAANAGVPQNQIGTAAGVTPARISQILDEQKPAQPITRPAAPNETRAMR